MIRFNLKIKWQPFHVLYFNFLPTEGDDCFIPKVGRGFCKRAFDCRWIRDNEIPENEWKICRYNEINPLVCCQDPIIDRTRRLDCEENVFNFADAQLCFGMDGMKTLLLNGEDQMMNIMEDIETNSLLKNEMIEKEPEAVMNFFEKEFTKNETSEESQSNVFDTNDIFEVQAKMMKNLESEFKSGLQTNFMQVRQFHVVRQPGFNFGYITFIKQT